MNKQLNGKALDQLIAAQYQLLTEENKAKVNRLVARLAAPCLFISAGVNFVLAARLLHVEL